MKPCAHRPDIRFFTGVQKCRFSWSSVVTYSIPCLLPSVHPFLEIPPFVLFAIWRQKRSPMRGPPDKIALFLVRHMFLQSHDCAPQTRITWLEGRENHFMGVRAKIYSSCLEVLLLHRLETMHVDHVTYSCVYAADFPKFVQCFRLEWNKKTWRKLENFWTKLEEKRICGQQTIFIYNNR